MISMRSVLRVLRPGRAGSALAYAFLAGGLALTVTTALPACSNADQGDDLNPQAARSLEVAQAGNNPCNPCAGKNPCNPCAGKNPCNPCAGKNPCNPCGANPCNPCAGKNPCNPCGMNPCNPCGANPCNPCAGKNPCNPCGAAMNPCNPCGMNPCNPCGGAMVEPSKFAKPAGMSMGGGDRAALVAEGEELWKDTSLSTNGAACATCHVGGAQFQKSFAKPYPHQVAMVKQMSGVDEVDAAEMVQFCMLQPMQADALPWGSRELAALSAYVEHVQQDYMGNPCALQGSAGANPCNPCAMGNPCNPCAMKNPCNPCGAAMNPCNPCAMKNPCNPCAGKNPCNPCGAGTNPCNPCGGS